MNNEEVKTTETKETAEATESTAEKKPIVNPLLDPEEQLRRFSKGKMALAVPIRSGGKDVAELNYDFLALTGMEFVEALDRDTKNSNAFRISNAQAFSLFAAAAGKATDGIDATDIRERMSARDAVKAGQLATIFFSASNRAGNRRISDV